MGSLRVQFVTAEGSADVVCVEVAFREGKVGVGDCESHGTGPVSGGSPAHE